MTISELVTGFMASSGDLALATEKFEAAKLAYLAQETALRSQVSDNFARYLDDRSEIPKETFTVGISWKDKPFVRIILGSEENEGPREVTPKFREFSGRYRPLVVEILRYFPHIETMVVRPDSYYGNPRSYKPLDIAKAG